MRTLGLVSALILSAVGYSASATSYNGSTIAAMLMSPVYQKNCEALFGYGAVIQSIQNRILTGSIQTEQGNLKQFRVSFDGEHRERLFCDISILTNGSGSKLTVDRVEK